MRKKHLCRVMKTTTISALALLCSLGYISHFHYLPSDADEDVVVDIVAHRGYSSQYPENTLSSFAGAIAIDAKYVEFDVRKTSDDVIVVYHDDAIAHVVNAGEEEKGVEDYTYEELLTLDVGSWYSSDFAMERIPTLDQTLALFEASNTMLIIEMKCDTADADFPEQVFETVAAHDMLDRVIFSSFEYETLMDIKELNPEQPIMMLASFGKSTLPAQYPAEYYGINMKTLTPATIQAVHEIGSEIFSYTPAAKGQIISLQRLGVDGVITDYPDINEL